MAISVSIKDYRNGLLLGANYTFSSLLSNNDESLAATDLADSSPPVPQNYFNRHPEWSRSAFDRPHRFVIFSDYTTPGLPRAAALSHLVKDWEVSGSSEWQSAQAFGIRTGVDSVG